MSKKDPFDYETIPSSSEGEGEDGSPRKPASPVVLKKRRASGKYGAPSVGTGTGTGTSTTAVTVTSKKRGGLGFMSDAAMDASASLFSSGHAAAASASFKAGDWGDSARNRNKRRRRSSAEAEGAHDRRRRVRGGEKDSDANIEEEEEADEEEESDDEETPKWGIMTSGDHVGRFGSVSTRKKPVLHTKDGRGVPHFILIDDSNRFRSLSYIEYLAKKRKLAGGAGKKKSSAQSKGKKSGSSTSRRRSSSNITKSRSKSRRSIGSTAMNNSALQATAKPGSALAAVASAIESARCVDGDDENYDDCEDDNGGSSLAAIVGGMIGQNIKIGEYTAPKKRELLFGLLDLQIGDVFRDVDGDGAYESFEPLWNMATKMGKTKRGQYDIQLVGEYLGQLYAMIKDCYPDGANDKKLRGKAKALLKDLVTIGKAAEEMAATKAAEDRAKDEKHLRALYRKPKGILPQERYPFDSEERSRLPCPKCDHESVMGYLDMAALKDEHKKKMKEWKKAVSKWEKQPPSTRSAKPPKEPKIPNQEFACYCVKMHCNEMDNGNGCYLCEETAAAGETYVEDIDGHTRCRCDICECQCVFTFKERDRQRIVQARELEDRMKQDGNGTSNEEDAGRSFAKSLLATLKSGELVASNLNKKHDEEDVMSAVSAEMAHECPTPHQRHLLQQVIPSSKKFKTTGKSANDVLGVGGNSRKHRNHLDAETGVGLKVTHHSASSNRREQGYESDLEFDTTSESLGSSAEEVPRRRRDTPIIKRVAQKALLANVHEQDRGKQRKNAAFTQRLLDKDSDTHKAASAMSNDMCSQDAFKALRIHDQLLKGIEESDEENND